VTTEGESGFMTQNDKNNTLWSNRTDDSTVQLQREQSKITISDVAEALEVSKTTVSRAISGKGRISESTRKRVLAYIKETHYRPNVVAKGLANSKTYNIGWVVPGEFKVADLPFFQRCMMGVSEVAASEDYDILFSQVFDNDMSQLKHVVKNRKVDGIVLGRTLVEDERIDFLMESGIPFVVIGSSTDERVIQIDNDHIHACKELTSILLMKGLERLALIGGESNHVVNQTRQQGFEMGLKEQGRSVVEELIYMDCESEELINQAVEDSLNRHADCIVCMDDRICHQVLNKLHQDGVAIPDEIKIASFYNSVILESSQPPVTALCYDPKELGAVACRTLFDYIAGKEVAKRTLLGYEVVLKGSTQ
jgi:DNA-binding LacI/PurR family transcriptional regulator